MIFKTLFTPAHKHSDPEKRKGSIDKLDPNKEADKSILHELAFNDDNDAVTLAALHKLDSFVLWMKKADTAHSPIVKKKAQQICIELLAHEEKVNDSLFESFVMESKNKHLLNTLLFENVRLQQHPSLSLTVLFSLDNEQANRRFFIELANENQQLKIIEKTEDAKVLGKFAKQSSHQSVINLIGKKLQVLELRKSMPAKIKQNVTLINSRLLALKDTSDYEYLQTELSQLTENFEQAKTDFVYLDEATIALLSEKYLTLKTAIEKKQTILEAEYKDQLLLKKTSNDLHDIQERLSQVEIQVDLLFSSEDGQIDSQVKILGASVESAHEELFNLSKEAKTPEQQQLCKHLQTQVTLLQTRLHDVPAMFAVCQQAQTIIDLLQTNLKQYDNLERLDYEPLQEFEALIQRTKTEFNALQNKQTLLPENKRKAFSQAVTLANKKLKSFNAFFLNVERKCENKLKVVNSMISEGKFKPAMSTFYHVQKLLETLPQGIAESRNTRLRKAYENTAIEVQKLQDWQAYIAQPRKPALLAEVETLAASNMDDAYVRVDAVKQLRAQWSSFGQLHTEEDNALNKAFDELIERAFEPCRAFFADLEKLRSDNLRVAQNILQEVSEISDETPAIELSSILGSLKTRLNKVGDIDKSELRKIKRQFSKAIAPLNQRVNDFYAANAQQKQRLIDKVIKLASEEQSSDKLHEAADEAKALQKQWKLIGFAGREQENTLWQSFREQNDAIFNRYHESVNTIQAENTQLLESLNGKVQAIDKQVKAAKTHADLSFYEEAMHALESEVDSIEDKLQNKVKSKIERLASTYKGVLQKLNTEKSNQATQHLFDFLKDYTDDGVPDKFDALAGTHRAWVKGDVKPLDTLQGLNRDDLVQVALIINENAPGNVEFGDKNRRKELQMKLMAAKMEGGDTVLPDAILAAWVSQKQVKPEEMAGLSILEKMY